MSKTKIAPRLRRMVETRTCGQAVCGGTCECHHVLAELRGLLALERAIGDWRSAHPGGLTVEEERIVTAHDRLARVSGRSDRGRAK